MLAFGPRQSAVGAPASFDDPVVHDPVATLLAPEVRGGFAGTQERREVPEVERRGAAEALVEPGLRQLGLLDTQAGQPLLPVGPVVDLDVLGVEPTALSSCWAMFASDWPCRTNTRSLGIAIRLACHGEVTGQPQEAMSSCRPRCRRSHPCWPPERPQPRWRRARLPRSDRRCPSYPHHPWACRPPR